MDRTEGTEKKVKGCLAEWSARAMKTNCSNLRLFGRFRIRKRFASQIGLFWQDFRETTHTTFSIL